MTRKQAITVLKAAGAEGDKPTWMRVYAENRISFAVAQQAWRDGQAFARFVAQRDASAAP